MMMIHDKHLDEFAFFFRFVSIFFFCFCCNVLLLVAVNVSINWHQPNRERGCLFFFFFLFLFENVCVMWMDGWEIFPNPSSINFFQFFVVVVDISCCHFPLVYVCHIRTKSIDDDDDVMRFSVKQKENVLK